MASTLLEPLADVLKTTLEGITVDGHSGTVAVKAYRWAPQQLSSLPAAVVEIPVVRRTEPGEAETELGRDDWAIAFPVILYVKWTGTPDRDMQRAVEFLEDFIAAVDDNPYAAVDGVEDAKVVSAEPEIVEIDEHPVMLQYVTEVQVALSVDPNA